jgi:hypothetical protein
MLHATTAGFQICFAATCLSNSTASLLFCADALHVMGIFGSVFFSVAKSLDSLLHMRCFKAPS